MKLKVLDTVICRTPVFSVNDKLEEKWHELKILISEASPSFYQIIKQIDLPSNNIANKKIDFSVWKYFNRAKYRPTPFGGFAAFTPILCSHDDSSPLVLSKNISGKHLINWENKDKHLSDFNIVVKSSAWLQTNSTVYNVGNEVRYIRFKNECFEMASVTAFPELMDILELCKKKTSKQEVYGYMKIKHQLNEKDMDVLLVQLLTLQLLLTELFPNITGEDYFERMKIEMETSVNNYTISERKLISGSFDKNKVKEISELIKLLHLNLPASTSKQLSDFCKAFQKKFDHAAVPLHIVMDPEAGIGYGSLGHLLHDESLVDIFNSVNESGNPDLQISYTKLYRFLLNALIRQTEIRLEEFDGNETENSVPLPNSFSAMLHFYDGQPVITSLGGCTATALIGRFTIASPEIEKFGKQIASLEEKANPDILFFDIAYQGEKRVDNVNRRKQLYKSELPILTWSSDPSPIHLDDILVSVRNSEVILWSKKFDMRMIPRIPSAYNYTRSDLAVFRFLCDLQHQGIRSDMTFYIQQFFPNLEHYPRVVFKRIILSPAMWLIPLEILKLNEGNDPSKTQKALGEWLKRSAINFIFRSGFSDQTLCFDPKIEADMKSFLLFCRQNPQKDIYISEALLSNESAVKDDNGKPYEAEYIVSYSHDDTIYSGHQHLKNCKKPGHLVNKISLPGNDWLYFEIYCHPFRSNGLLINQIALFLKNERRNIKRWFFIRYEDPKPHLRFRLQLKEISQGYLFIRQLTSLLEEDCLNGLISDIQIKTYVREFERYGVKRISMVEDFFYSNSKVTLSILEKKYTTIQLYSITIAIIQKLIGCRYKDINAQIAFVTNMADSFKKELGMNNEGFKKLNQFFEKHKEIIAVNTLPGFQKLFGRYEIEFVDIMNFCNNELEQVNMMADLFHMHINRLFISHQRIHEAIIYHYLLKVLKTRRGISAVSMECPTVT